jgi:DNA-binding NarL/FixJ family response regulator
MNIMLFGVSGHYREILSTYLGLQDGIKVFGPIESEIEADRILRSGPIDVVLIDLDKIIAETLKMLERWRSGGGIAPRIVVITVRRELWLNRRLSRLGVDSYLRKSSGIGEILKKIRRAGAR